MNYAVLIIFVCIILEPMSRNGLFRQADWNMKRRNLKRLGC